MVACLMRPVLLKNGVFKSDPVLSSEKAEAESSSSFTNPATSGSVVRKPTRPALRARGSRENAGRPEEASRGRSVGPGLGRLFSD